VIVVLAVAAAVFSITRTIRSSQGRNMGSLGGFAGKADLMRGSGQEEAPQPGRGGPANRAGSGMEGPSQGMPAGGKGSGL